MTVKDTCEYGLYYLNAGDKRDNAHYCATLRSLEEAKNRALESFKYNDNTNGKYIITLINNNHERDFLDIVRESIDTVSISFSKYII